MSVKDKLQIILITYNREKHVQKTFERLFIENSPIKDYDLLVLDNNSTDGTEAFVNQFIKTHPNVRYQKNKYNVGISGNIAKAMEIAEQEYVWIICDDDKYDFSNWHEVEKAIENKEEAICVARYGINDEFKDLYEFHIGQITFVPAVIFKTSNFTDTVMRNVFDNIYTLFPHLCPLMAIINQGKRIYVVDKAIVDNGMDEKTTDCSYTRGLQVEELYKRTESMTWIVGYANICSIIKDKGLKSRALNNGFNGIHGGFDKFCNDVIGIYSSMENWPHLMDLFVNLTKKQQKVFIKKLFINSVIPIYQKKSKNPIIRVAKEIGRGVKKIKMLSKGVK